MGLFDPKWLNDEEETKKLKDPVKLKRAALNGKTIYVRYIAVNQLLKVDRAAFIEIATQAPEPSVRDHAVLLMRDDRSFLPVVQEMAQNDEDQFVRESAVNQLTRYHEQERRANRTPREVEADNLNEAISAYYEQDRKKALDHLRQDESFAECALRCKTHELRTSAIYRIKDDAALVKLALRYMDLDQRRKYLTPEGVKWYRREAGIAIGRVRSQEMLDELAHHENRLIRQCALENENCSEALRKAYLAEKQLEEAQRKEEYYRSRDPFTDDGDINAP